MNFDIGSARGELAAFTNAFRQNNFSKMQEFASPQRLLEMNAQVQRSALSGDMKKVFEFSFDFLAGRDVDIKRWHETTFKFARENKLPREIVERAEGMYKVVLEKMDVFEKERTLNGIYTKILGELKGFVARMPKGKERELLVGELELLEASKVALIRKMSVSEGSGFTLTNFWPMAVAGAVGLAFGMPVFAFGTARKILGVALGAALVVLGAVLMFVIVASPVKSSNVLMMVNAAVMIVSGIVTAGAATVRK